MLNNSTIYCLATGKPIAEISDDEYGTILEAFSHLPNPDAHLEELTLNSMRPSLMWANITPTILENIRVAAPRQLLAYLLNRMYAPLERPKSHQPVNRERFYQSRRFRVEIWQKLESATFTDDQIGQLLHILLELDTRFNLATLDKPIAIAGLWNPNAEASWTDSLIIQLHDWMEILIAKQIKEERLAKVSADWWANGNKLTRSARFGAFMEAKPVTKTGAKKAAKKADDDLFASILEGLMSKETPIGKQETAPMIPAKQKMAAVQASAIVNRELSHTTFKAPGTTIRFGVKRDA